MINFIESSNDIHFPNLIVTGGTGYLGAAFVSAAVAKGFNVIMLGRHKQEIPDVDFIKWSLGEPIPAEVFTPFVHPQSCAVIHLAHDWNVNIENELEDFNLASTQILLDSSANFGVIRFVFASSQSAREDAINIYGRVKWRIENLVTKKNGVSARIGLIYGGRKLGQYGSLVKLTRLPVLPMLTPSSLVQPIHLSEVSDALLKLSQSSLTGFKFIANPVPIRFGDFLKDVSRVEHGSSLIVIPISLKLALLGAYLTKFIPGLPTIDRERVLGLAGATIVSSQDDLNEIGVTLGQMNGLSTSALGVKALLIEGSTLIRYILCRKPSIALMKRYVRAVTLQAPLSKKSPIGLPFWTIAFPSLICLMEILNRNASLIERLEIASLLSENSEDGGKVFFNSNTKYKLLSLIGLTIRLSVDFMFIALARILAQVGKK